MHIKESDLILRLENRIPAYYVSLNSQPKFYTLASMLLESAAIHSAMHGFGYYDMIRKRVYWVLSRFHVIMHAYPVMDQPVVIETWHKGSDKLFFTRDYRMFSEGGQLFSSATSAWLILDGATGRPRKPEEGNDFNEFGVPDLHAVEALPGKLPGLKEADRKISRTARYSDMDINKHVNAIKYIEWVQDFYGEETYANMNVCEFQINYQAETRFGEEVEIRIKKIPGNDSFDHFEGIRIQDDSSAFRARIKFGTLN